MYKPLRFLVCTPLHLYYKFSIVGHEKIPVTGGAIVASNHVSFVDAFAVAYTVKRPIHFMAKEEIFRNRVMGYLFGLAHVFPVRRGGADRKALERALNVVQEGNLLGIFPEGTRNSEGEDLLPLQGGTALIALKTGVPVVPIVISGFTKLKFRVGVQVKVGDPLFFGTKKATKSEIQEVSREISQQFRVLLGRKNP